MSADELSIKLTAISSAQRMRIIAMLAGERLHVSELARRVGMSRALLYMHLTKLEESGYVAGSLELSEDGKALKYFEVLPFTLTIDAETLVAAVARSAESAESGEI
ncbi:ArsR family transcriptional regulator [Salinibacterium hongtaonis]|nr:ArsR family transcriptional regulator [Salinibacterium hongtaonis]